MIFKEGTKIKAINKDTNEEVHGFVMFDENFEQFVTGPTPTPLSKLINVRLTEEAPKGEVVDQILTADINKIDPKKVKDAEKLGDQREKELIKMKVLKGDEGYKDKFAAGIMIAKAANGNGTKLFNRSCLDKVKKRESINDTIEQSEKLIEDESIPLKGDTIVGEKEELNTMDNTQEDDIIPAINSTEPQVEATPTSAEDVQVSDTDTNVVDNFIADNSGTATETATEPATSDTSNDIMYSSDDITDYSQFLDPVDTSTAPITTPEEDALIADAVSSPVSVTTATADDIKITISNPKDSPIEIKINGKEAEINNEIDAELDSYIPESGKYTNEDFFKHLCEKYNCDSSKLLHEGISISEAICNLIIEVASRKD